MNQHPGVIGRKIGMTQVVLDDGTVIPCTVIQASPIVVGKRTQEKDGYDALVLGTVAAKEKHLTKPALGSFKKAGVPPQRQVREFRCSAEDVAKFDIGAEVKVDAVFTEGQFVDVRGVSRGRGFSGVMRRHNFHGQTQTHGTHEFKRHGGSIGTNMTPGRVKPGVKMPGQHGNKRNSVLNQKIVQVLADKNLVLVRGAVPGPTNGLVEVRGAVKKSGGAPKA
jgi:large subunit ribosomal protein L3